MQRDSFLLAAVDTHRGETLLELTEVDVLVPVLIETSHKVNHVRLEVVRSASRSSNLVENSGDWAFKENVSIVLLVLLGVFVAAVKHEFEPC